jgi:hypothetical protein
MMDIKGEALLRLRICGQGVDGCSVRAIESGVILCCTACCVWCACPGNWVLYILGLVYLTMVIDIYVF